MGFGPQFKIRNHLRDKAKKIEEKQNPVQDHLKVLKQEILKVHSDTSHSSAQNKFIKEEDQEIDETEDEANNIMKNKLRRQKVARRFQGKPKSIDSDNPIEGDDVDNCENA